MLNIIKQLRQQTGIGISDCKKALDEAKGNITKAIEILRKKGGKIIVSKQNREIKHGLIEAYIHPGGKIGALIELGCETDFVARNEKFKTLAHDLVMQITATNPLYLAPEDIPKGIVEKEKEIIKEEFKNKKMKEEIMEKIIKGKLEKYYQEACLLKQPFIKDDKIKIEDLISKEIVKLGENIKIVRFTRYSLS